MGAMLVPGGGAAGAFSNVGNGPVIVGTCAAATPVSAIKAAPANAVTQRKFMAFPSIPQDFRPTAESSPRR
jgi:hypothetical protein